MIVEISTHGSSIHRKSERFVIKIPDQKDVEIPAQKVEAILVRSNTMISTQVMQLCIEKHIQLVITSFTGKPIARMWSSFPGRQTKIRRQQYINYNTEFAFDFTKKLLHQKLCNQKNFLAELKQNRKSSPLTDRLSYVIDYIRSIMTDLEKQSYNKDFAQKFLGFEGSCAAKYFQMISACLPKKWQFESRSQNPGIDEFNASLNYMYGMAYVGVEKVVILSGLDPNAGFYHKDHYGKPTLVYDLIEPCRPAIDKALMYLFSRKIVKDNWFSSSMTNTSNAIQLTKTGRYELISAYKSKCLKPVERQTWKNCRDIVSLLLLLDKKGVSK